MVAVAAAAAPVHAGVAEEFAVVAVVVLVVAVGGFAGGDAAAEVSAGAVVAEELTPRLKDAPVEQMLEALMLCAHPCILAAAGVVGDVVAAVQDIEKVVVEERAVLGDVRA